LGEQNARIGVASVLIAIDLTPPRLTADIACRDDRGAVTVGNEAPVWQCR
jgi:hypothetical protein